MKLKSKHKSSKWLAAATAAGLLTVPAAPALAATADAQLTNFAVTFFDLAPLDGIPAGIQWSGGQLWNTGTTKTQVNYSGDGGVVNVSPSVGGLFSSFANYSSSSSTAGGSAMASGGWSYAALGSSASLSASGYANQGVLLDSKFNNSAMTYGNFTLTPSTIMLIMADALVSASADSGQSADAWVEMSVKGASQESKSFLETSTTYVANSSLSQQLYLTFANLTNQPMQATFSALAKVNGIAPVPEPETYAMLLAGLGLVAGMAKRRRKIAA